MAEPDDLLDKADALMARHRPARAAAEPHPDIPVLNEVVELPREADGLPVLTELVEPKPLREAQSEFAAASLAERMRASLLAVLQPEIDRLIEERLKVALEPLVTKLFEDMHRELQSIAHATLSDAIHAAVKRELDRHKAPD